MWGGVKNISTTWVNLNFEFRSTQREKEKLKIYFIPW